MCVCVCVCVCVYQCGCIAVQPDAHMFPASKPEAFTQRRLWNLTTQFYTNNYFSSLELRLIFGLFEEDFSAENEGILNGGGGGGEEGHDYYLFNIVQHSGKYTCHLFNLRLCVLPRGDIYVFRIFSQAALTFPQTE